MPLVCGCQSDKVLSPEPDISNDQKLVTYCNPLDLNYRFSLDEPARREAADPTVVWFKDRYFLFASKSGGYWHSKTLAEWVFVKTDQIPTEEYAPTVIGVKDTLYFLASSTEKSTIYKSADPLSGKWSVARDELEIPVWDPAFFLDDDQRLYLYWGCSNETPLYGIELDYSKNFDFVGDPIELKHANPKQFGWEVPGDYNTRVDQSPWIEGAWMNKHKGKYYLQYSGPGTEFKSYSDGVYVSESPLGPYEAQKHNPFAYRPEGFAAGAGHGSTFKDRFGNYWHIGTITISQKHIFERRLGLFPAFFDENGTLYCDTSFGDYPMVLAQEKISDIEDIFPGWMLLSYDKKVTVSSSVDSLDASNLNDEDIRTYWAARTGEEGEYALIDLEESCEIHAIQVNFGEHDIRLAELKPNPAHRFQIESSTDNENWTILIDRSNNNSDKTHFYFQLADPVDARFLKIMNLEVPGGSFAISGFRVFGKGSGDLPSGSMNITAARNKLDRRRVNLSWKKAKDATGYNIRYGTDPKQLYQNYQVYKDTSVTINSLHADLEYFFSVEAFNENGRTSDNVVVSAN
jgi:hypothetical protein